MIRSTTNTLLCSKLVWSVKEQLERKCWAAPTIQFALRYIFSFLKSKQSVSADYALFLAPETTKISISITCFFFFSITNSRFYLHSHQNSASAFTHPIHMPYCILTLSLHLPLPLLILFPLGIPSLWGTLQKLLLLPPVPAVIAKLHFWSG